jgi:peptidoglycan/xylan/chitin deacetylase (PgdA/CDA1 family)
MTKSPMTEGGSCILTYHSLDTSGSVISISPSVFRKQMEWLAAARVPVVPLERIRETPGGVALTFDDGFKNFFEHAAPVLHEYRFPATVFAVSDFCGRGNRWPSQPAHHAIPRLELMDWNELREIRKAGIQIGSHTATHPYLSRLSEAAVEEEMHRSRSVIEQHLGMPVDTFAYPYGDWTPMVRAVAARSFRLGCGTELAYLSASDDALCLPRVDMYYLRNGFWFRGLDRGYGKAWVLSRNWLRILRQRLIVRAS